MQEHHDISGPVVAEMPDEAQMLESLSETKNVTVTDMKVANPNHVQAHSDVLGGSIDVAWDPKTEQVKVNGVPFTEDEVRALKCSTLGKAGIRGAFIIKDVFQGFIGEPPEYITNTIKCQYKGIARAVVPAVCEWHKEMGDKDCRGCKRMERDE